MIEEGVGVAEEIGVDVEVFSGAAMPVGCVSGVEEGVGVAKEIAEDVSVFSGAAVPVGSVLGVGALVADKEGEDDGAADEEVVTGEEVDFPDEVGPVEKEMLTGTAVADGTVLIVVFEPIPVERPAGIVLLVDMIAVRDVLTGAAVPTG